MKSKMLDFLLVHLEFSHPSITCAAGAKISYMVEMSVWLCLLFNFSRYSVPLIV